MGAGLHQLAQQIVSGISIGAIYGLIAMGFVMIFTSLGVFNWAHSDLFVIGGFLGLYLYGTLKVPYLAVIIVVILINALIGVLLERIALSRLVMRGGMNYLICTIGIGIVIRNAIRIFVGSQSFLFPTVFGQTPLNIAGVMVLPHNIMILLMTVALTALLLTFFAKTTIGKSMRAVSQDQEAARMMGINVRRCITWTYAISTALGGAAGVLVGPLFFISAEFGPPFGNKAFAAFVLGGVTSIPGALLGGILLGVAENLVGGYLSSAYKDAVAFIVIVAILFVKPTGLLGGKSVIRG